MKRLFILLGAIILSFSLTSCKEKNMYEEYEKSQLLNEELLSLFNYNTIDPNEFSYITLDNIDFYFGENFNKYYVSVEESNTDYYICGYLDESIKKDLEENIAGIIDTSFNYNVGNKDYISTWAYFIHKKGLSLNEYPIYWYKIPKTDEVPLTFKNKFLVMVNEILLVTYEDFNTSETHKTEMLFENKSFYINDWDRESNLYYKGQILQFISKFGSKPYEKKIYFSWDYMVEYNYGSLKIEQYNGIKYLNFRDYTIYHDEDLKNRLEYITDEKGNICFKLEDILNEVEEKA